jgi:hypothetical protein
MMTSPRTPPEKGRVPEGPHSPKLGNDPAHPGGVRRYVVADPPSPLVTARENLPRSYWSSRLAPSSLCWTMNSSKGILAATRRTPRVCRLLLASIGIRWYSFAKPSVDSRVDLGEDIVLGLEGLELVPQKVELRVGDLGLARVVPFLMTLDQPLELARALRPRHR